MATQRSSTHQEVIAEAVSAAKIKTVPEKYQERLKRAQEKMARGIAAAKTKQNSLLSPEERERRANILANPDENCNVPLKYWKALGQKRKGSKLEEFAAGFPGGKQQMLEVSQLDQEIVITEQD